MEQTNAPVSGTRPGLLSVITILTMIGSGIMALFCLIGIFASGWIISFISGKVEQVANSPEMDAYLSDTINGAQNAENMQKASEAVGGLAAMGTGLIIAVFVIGLLLNILKFMGAMKMYKQNKGGFWMYMVPAFIVLLLCLISMQWVSVIVFGAFIGGYFSIKKSLI
ncbi:MAG: hypothetical protein M3R17_14745 [Bacteroidota bacterium]|nr:hypothetical protein [Bacteroidota bacterium]